MREYSEPGDHYALVEDLEQSRQLQDNKKIQKFSCACCHFILEKLPPIAQEALNVGDEFSKGRVSGKQPEEERVKLWGFLGNDSCDFGSPRVNAPRAVICCLYENQDLDHAYDHVRAVMDFCNAVENREREQFDLLLEVFNVRR
jgi:hypothetical protein